MSVIGLVTLFNLGDVKNRHLCGTLRSFMLVFCGQFDEARELELNLMEEAKLHGELINQDSCEAVLAIINLLQGNFEKVMQHRLNFQKRYYEAPTPLRAAYQGIYAQMELYEGNYDNALDCIQRMIDFYPKVHYSNCQVFYNTVLAILVMYSILENPIEEIKEKRGLSKRDSLTSGSHFPSPRKGPKLSLRSNDLGGYHTGYNRIRHESTVHRTVTTSTIDEMISTLGEDIPERLRTRSHTVLPHKQRIKKLAIAIGKGLFPFGKHSLYKPCELLLAGLMNLSDGMMMNDTAKSFSEWVNVNQDNKQFRYMVAVLSMKCWRFGDKTEEWRAESAIAEQMKMEMAIPDQIQLVHALVDSF